LLSVGKEWDEVVHLSQVTRRRSGRWSFFPSHQPLATSHFNLLAS
jgi:hypothetical protein